MSMSSGKTTFTLAEAAELLSCHRETLRRAIRNGDLRAAKLGRGFRISRFDLESFWTASGGGDLFGKTAEGESRRPPEEALNPLAKGKRGRKKTPGSQEQLSFLNSLEVEKDTPPDDEE